MEEFGMMIKVEMEQGMWFEFSGKEDEEPAQDVAVKGPDVIVVRFVYFDIRNPDENHNHQVIDVSRLLFTRRILMTKGEDCDAWLMGAHFKEGLGHGLSPKELKNCMSQFKAVMHRQFSASPLNNANHGHRQFNFDVKRIGVVGTRYHAREMEIREEEAERRRRMREMVRAGLCPADPDSVYRLVGNSRWPDDREYQKGEDCAICFEGFEHGEYITELFCSHIYHTVCITQWSYRKNTCPICREPIKDLYQPNPYL